MEHKTFDKEGYGIPVLTYEELTGLLLGYDPWQLGFQLHQVQSEPLFNKIGIEYNPDEKYKGISSLILLKEVGNMLEEQGFLINNIDATIIAQAPKMRPHIDTMRENIAKALQIDVSVVNVKATTEEGLGFTGSGEGISSQAICLLTSPFDLSATPVQMGCAGCSGCAGGGQRNI
ncbi:MAG: 2-C-methyl-D-erythritol 2,4-cyclodiphosphate synthase [Lachnospiraceae bacterium]|nr:2-C-methyl-D-erythritol 2,4-cyclodiphosphate synthase [Lachnospiraceae bacterium]